MGKENSSEEKVLMQHGVRPTAVRLMVYRAIAGMRDTFSMGDVETALDTVDKSTVFRTLSLFAAHHLLHETEDGSGSKKYCLCHNDHVCSIEELHCHFYCENCHKTFCIGEESIPVVNAPAGFAVSGIHYLMKGLCADCAPHEPAARR